MEPFVVIYDNCTKFICGPVDKNKMLVTRNEDKEYIEYDTDRLWSIAHRMKLNKVYLYDKLGISYSDAALKIFEKYNVEIITQYTGYDYKNYYATIEVLEQVHVTGISAREVYDMYVKHIKGSRVINEVVSSIISKQIGIAFRTYGKELSRFVLQAGFDGNKELKFGSTLDRAIRKHLTNEINRYSGVDVYRCKSIFCCGHCINKLVHIISKLDTDEMLLANAGDVMYIGFIASEEKCTLWHVDNITKIVSSVLPDAIIYDSLL